MKTPPPTDQHEFIDWALHELELSPKDVDQLGDRIGFKSLKRARSGEIKLTEDRRQHLLDLVRLRGVGINPMSAVVAEDAHEYRLSTVPPHFIPPSDKDKTSQKTFQENFADASLMLSEIFRNSPELLESVKMILQQLVAAKKSNSQRETF